MPGREPLIPDKAKVCGFCEAAVENEPTAEEEEVVRDLLGQMPPEALEELRAAFAKSETAEDFVDRIFVGDCPKCGSEETGNCAADPEIGEDRFREYPWPSANRCWALGSKSSTLSAPSARDDAPSL